MGMEVCGVARHMKNDSQMQNFECEWIGEERAKNIISGLFPQEIRWSKSLSYSLVAA